jgi:5-methyltetrahydrofolate--homocysteine methyltransferase
MIQNGANLIGGCCGTNPDYIKRMAEVIKENKK